MSFPCPVPLCKHHTIEPFPLEALLNTHVDAAEHSFIDEWKTGPAPPQIDDVGQDNVTIWWAPVPGATHYELQLKQLESSVPTTTTTTTTTTSPNATSNATTPKHPVWTTVSSTLTGTIVKKKHLLSHATYLFRYRCRDNKYTGGCLSPWSSHSSEATTLASNVVRPAPPTLYVKNGTTATSLTVQWEDMKEKATSGYDLQMRQVSFPPLEWSPAATVSGNAVKKKGLLPSTKYEFRVCAHPGNPGNPGNPGSGSSSSVVYSAPSAALSTFAPYNPFKQLLGPSLINGQRQLLSLDATLSSTKVVLLYFSASWCPPCKQFTPKLAAFYTAMKRKQRSLEIVFVSGDRDIQSFEQYLREEHPWTAIPYTSPTRQQVQQYFKVNGIPKLMVFNGTTGAVVCNNAVQQPLTEAALDNWERA